MNVHDLVESTSEVTVIVTVPKEKAVTKETKPAAVVAAPQKAFTAADIKDEDMMVAALIATIEFNQETKEDAKLVSIKQIG